MSWAAGSPVGGGGCPDRPWIGGLKLKWRLLPPSGQNAILHHLVNGISPSLGTCETRRNSHGQATSHPVNFFLLGLSCPFRSQLPPLRLQFVSHLPRQPRRGAFFSRQPAGVSTTTLASIWTTLSLFSISRANMAPRPIFCATHPRAISTAFERVRAPAPVAACEHASLTNDSSCFP